MALSLTETIEQLKADKISSTKLLRSIKKIVKALHLYATDSQKLPPETLIPCVLFILPQKISQGLLGLQPNEVFQQAPEKLSINLLLQLYLKSLLKLLQQSSTEISHVIVEGMSRNCNLLPAFPIIAKKWLKTVIKIWSQSQQNLNLSLRCHILIQKYLQNSSVQMFSWVLRRMYVSYFDNAKQVSWQNFEHINFMINSFCEILKINQSRSYYVLFGYIRSIALQLDKFNKSKGKQKIELMGKLYTNQILSCLKLFSAVASRNICEQFTALIYPLIEIMTAYTKLTQNPQFLPLKLKIIDFTLQISEALNIYIPCTFDLLEKVISNKVFIKKIQKKGENVADNVQIIYRLSKTDLNNAQLVNYMFKSTIVKMYKFIVLSLRNVYGVQIVQKLGKILRNLKQEYHYNGFKIQLSKAIKFIDKDIQRLYNLRKKASMGITEQRLIIGYQQKRQRNNSKLSTVKQYQNLKEQQQSILKNKLLAERQQDGDIGEKNQQSIQQNPEQIESGWQQASQGASQFEQPAQGEQSEQEGEIMDGISYEGDPDDPDKAAMEWSEHSWSSQNEIEG